MHTFCRSSITLFRMMTEYFLILCNNFVIIFVIIKRHARIQYDLNILLYNFRKTISSQFKKTVEKYLKVTTQIANNFSRKMFYIYSLFKQNVNAISWLVHKIFAQYFAYILLPIYSRYNLLFTHPSFSPVQG